MTTSTMMALTTTTMACMTLFHILGQDEATKPFIYWQQHLRIDNQVSINLFSPCLTHALGAGFHNPRRMPTTTTTTSMNTANMMTTTTTTTERRHEGELVQCC